MISLKKLRAFKLCLGFLLILISSCAKVPFVGLYTDQQYNLKDFNNLTLIVLHQNDLSSNVTWDYLQIAKNKLPSHKIYLFVINEFSEEEKKIIVNHLSLIDGYIFTKPILVDTKDEHFKNKEILNSGIIDLETDDYYLSPLSKRYTIIENKESKFLLFNNLEKLSMPQDDREFQFFAENPILGVFKMRKNERKNKNLIYLFLGNENINNQIKNQIFDQSKYVLLSEPRPDFFLLGENLIQFCDKFYKVTNDCFNDSINSLKIDDSIRSEREKLFKENSELINATFLGEDILTTN